MSKSIFFCVLLVACTRATPSVPPARPIDARIVDARSTSGFDASLSAIDAGVIKPSEDDSCAIPDPPHATLLPLDPMMYAEKNEAWQTAVTTCLRDHFIEAP